MSGNTGKGSFYEQNGGRFKGQVHMPPAEEKDYLNRPNDNYLGKLPAISADFQQGVDLFLRGAAPQLTWPCGMLEGYEFAMKWALVRNEFKRVFGNAD